MMFLLYHILLLIVFVLLVLSSRMPRLVPAAPKDASPNSMIEARASGCPKSPKHQIPKKGLLHQKTLNPSSPRPSALNPKNPITSRITRPSPQRGFLAHLARRGFHSPGIEGTRAHLKWRGVGGSRIQGSFLGLRLRVQGLGLRRVQGSGFRV